VIRSKNVFHPGLFEKAVKTVSDEQNEELGRAKKND
jgi:hypothetical protein